MWQPLWRDRTSPSPMLEQEVKVRGRLLLILGFTELGLWRPSSSSFHLRPALSERINDRGSLLRPYINYSIFDRVGPNVPSIDPFTLRTSMVADTCTSTDLIQLGRKPSLETDRQPISSSFRPTSRYHVHTRYPVSISS